MLWRPIPDYRLKAQGYPRGDVADFSPLLPSPFTLSVFQGGWEVACRAFPQHVDVPLPPGWVVAEGQVWCNPAFWEQAATAFGVDGPALEIVLGVRGLHPRPARPSRRGLLRFLRRPSSPAWSTLLDSAQRAGGAIQRWHRRVQGQGWTQADILQVMEEIAPFAGQVLYGYAIATLALAHTLTPHLSRGENALLPPAHLVSLKPLVQPEQAAHAFPWLGDQPFEGAARRWRDHPPQPGGKCSAIRSGPPEPWHEPLQVREAMRMALAQVMDAARTWVLAAAAEAVEDGRLRAAEEAFWLELEELKQMMTGEWSDPQRVQDIVAQRRDAWNARAATLPPPPGNARPEMVSLPDVHLPAEGQQALIAAPGWHPGWALWACRARGLLTLAKSPLSYGCLLARGLDIPLVDLGREEHNG